MLDQQDIKQIGNIVEQKVDAMGKGLEERLGVVIEEKIDQRVGAIVEEKIDQAIERKIIPQIGEMIDQNILPVLEDMNARLSKVERDMVTKDYLDDKLADLRGGLVAIDRKQDKKVNFLVESLDTNEVLPDSDIKLLRQMEVFPSPPRPNI